MHSCTTTATASASTVFVGAGVRQGGHGPVVQAWALDAVTAATPLPCQRGCASSEGVGAGDVSALQPGPELGVLAVRPSAVTPPERHADGPGQHRQALGGPGGEPQPSIVGKRRGNQTYYYLVESARVDGKPRIVSQQYLGSADEVVAELSGEHTGQPGAWTNHAELRCGAVPATSSGPGAVARTGRHPPRVNLAARGP